jgi:hypothetical protein
MAASLAGVSWATAGDEKAATESAADNAMSHLFALPMVRLLTRVLERHAAFWRSASRFFLLGACAKESYSALCDFGRNTPAIFTARLVMRHQGDPQNWPG